MAFEFMNSMLNDLQPSTSTNNDDDSDFDINESDIEIDLEHSNMNENDENNVLNDDSIDSSTPDGWTDSFHKVNILPFFELPGPKHSLPEDATDFFSLIINEDFYQLLAEQTNLFAEQCQQKSGYLDKTWRPVSQDEIRKFIYINFMFGIIVLPELAMYWSKDPRLRIPGVADVLPIGRYKKINQYFHMVDNTKQVPRGQDGYDPLFKIRPMIDMVIQNSQAYYYPGREISIDEAMISYKGRLFFKQYLKSKPTPWGMKVWCVADASNGYLCNFRFYTGKALDPMPDGVGHHVVLSCGEKYLSKGHHFYFDNFFSSVKLAEDLLEKNKHSCATIRTNRKGWPLMSQKLKKGECQMLQKGPMVATRWRDKREVTVLCTNSDAEMSTVIRKSKDGPQEIIVPLPILMYNKSMGGVDLADQHRSYYGFGRKSKKWWRKGLGFLFDVACINGFILMKESTKISTTQRSQPAISQLQFRLDMLNGLMQLSTRKVHMNIPTIAGQLKPNSRDHQLVRLLGRKKGCVQCIANKKKTPTGRTPETIYGCSFCSVHLCKGICYAKFHVKL